MKILLVIGLRVEGFGRTKRHVVLIGMAHEFVSVTTTIYTIIIVTTIIATANVTIATTAIIIAIARFPQRIDGG